VRGADQHGCSESLWKALGPPGRTRRLDRQWRSGSWVTSPTLTLTETVTCYSDQRNSSLLSASQTTMRLNGRLSARFSFQYNNESNPPPGRLNSDTVTRATLVYSF